MTKEKLKDKYSAFIAEISEIMGLGKPIDILKLCATTDLFFRPLENRITDLEKENAELKCECRTCVYTDSPCVRSDYPDKDGVCSHYKNVFEENAELKQENKVLAQNLEDTEILNKTYEKRFNDLEKENAELKSRDCWKSCLYASGKSELIHEILQKKYNLTKAKEIIKYLLSFIQKENYKTRWDINIAEAEQFLEEK